MSASQHKLVETGRICRKWVDPFSTTFLAHDVAGKKKKSIYTPGKRQQFIPSGKLT